jgi:hypothetical protein
LLFILRGSDELIEKRREKRSTSIDERKNEVKNTLFFRKVNQIYIRENSVFKKPNNFLKKL